MMKHCVPVFIFFIVAINCGAQNRDNIWMIGYNYTNQYPDIGISFYSNVFDTFSVQRKMQFFLTDASICDTAGELLFYTNGIYIANRNHDSLMNTEDFNPGYETNYYGSTGLGQEQGAIILPVPNNKGRFYCFSTSSDLITTAWGIDSEPLEMRYSIIDMSLDGGMGGIDPNNKKIPIIADTLNRGAITACKHANGRDWWVVCHGYNTNTFYRILVTPDSILGPYSQQIGITTSTYDLLCSARFSPDGTKYVWMENRDTLNFFDFDRCTGELSNDVMTITPADNYVTTGSSISVNSRYYYVGSLFGIFQYDLQAADIPSSVVQVAVYDTLQAGLWFSQMQLAPDGKIYIASYNGSPYLHVINDPDSAGLACNVGQSQIVMPSYNISAMPNFPNYDLGALAGSPCDTLTSRKEISASADFSISPNPASTQINIVYSIPQASTLTITDAYGRVVKQLTLYPYFKNRIVYLEGLAQGVYLVSLQGEKERVSEKLIVGY